MFSLRCTCLAVVLPVCFPISSAHADPLELWPELEPHCFLEDTSLCEQSADLDGDGTPDTLLTVQLICSEPPCPAGFVILSSAGHHLRIGAGESTELRDADFELIEDEVVWTYDTQPTLLDSDWRFLHVLRLEEAPEGSLCARAMKRDAPIVYLSGSDAASALFFHEEHGYIADCGY